eukprot:COSAG02_NODE_73_length_41919_cov_6.571066_22_plen_150_part_00
MISMNAKLPTGTKSGQNWDHQVLLTFPPFRRHCRRSGAIPAVQAPFPPFRDLSELHDMGAEHIAARHTLRSQSMSCRLDGEGGIDVLPPNDGPDAPRGILNWARHHRKCTAWKKDLARSSIRIGPRRPTSPSGRLCCYCSTASISLRAP